jgi:hypothetical protein
MLLNRYLDTVGDGSGSVDAKVDGSTTAVILKLNANATRRQRIHGLRIAFRDGITFEMDRYGSLSALANGVQVGWVNDAGDAIGTVVVGPITRNMDWLQVGRGEVHTQGTTKQLLVCQIDFPAPLEMKSLLESSGQQAFGVAIRDNLSALDDHTFIAVLEVDGA